MRRPFVSLWTLVMCMALVFPAAAQITLTVAETYPENHPTTQGLLKFAEFVNVRSSGEIVVDVKFGGALGHNEQSLVEQVQAGALDLARVSPASMTRFVPELEVMGLPYIWKSQESMWRVLKSALGTRPLVQLGQHNFYGLCYYETGARSFYNAKQPITSVHDLNGLRIRVQPSQFMIDFVTTLGATAIPIAFADVHDALRMGVVDGAENTWPVYESTGHYEVARFYTPDRHTRIPDMLIASKLALDKKLSPEQIDLVIQAAQNTQDYVMAQWNDYADAAQRIVIDSGAMITELSPEAVEEFFRAVQPLYATYAAPYSALIEEIRAAQR